ncbi:hypothetical protein J6590_095220 [Homalodisca vitripennis]|nr:hypothetical protein J6590_095220 [Homalodisca vitripennis]
MTIVAGQQTDHVQFENAVILMSLQHIAVKYDCAKQQRSVSYNYSDSDVGNTGNISTGTNATPKFAFVSKMKYPIGDIEPLTAENPLEKEGKVRALLSQVQIPGVKPVTASDYRHCCKRKVNGAEVNIRI